MKRIPISIIHCAGLSLVIILSVFAFSRTAVIGTSGGLNKITALFRYHHTAVLSCQVPPITALRQIKADKSVSYTCDTHACIINIFGKDHQLLKSFHAIDNAGIAIIDIQDLYYDPDREIIIYSTKVPDLSSRIVVNFQGELLQSIDETPGEDRQLTLLGYQPDTGMLVYRDSKSDFTYFYKTDSIYLARRKCH